MKINKNQLKEYSIFELGTKNYSYCRIKRKFYWRSLIKHGL